MGYLNKKDRCAAYASGLPGFGGREGTRTPGLMCVIHAL